MKYSFKLADFPDSNFEIEISNWTGKSKLLMDNLQIEQSKEKGKPYLIPSTNGECIKAFPKQSFPDLIPALEINGIKNQIVEKLIWFQYVLGGLPILLLFVGGAIGGAIGVLGAMLNFNIFRQEGTEISKYIKVIGVVAGSYILYTILTIFLLKLIN
ncbi:hypothetical protein EV196_10374 [Mariniflexile fucanivorans]|uniref:Uncharacterized protein n=1 Tax=Mariniflexile fucanivorans TaxID=264023 RepID=A0A4R1RKF5_9FLAO|nr:hypothetical protein [Mariniflexile fucanivorans]TCL66664.1 hypothetical protein EV196_10374 [Mariniflexile fucanivorans]